MSQLVPGSSFRWPIGKKPNRKEVIDMKYEKPEIILLASALSSIQAKKGSGIKDSDCPEGDGTSVRTLCAYKADE